MISFLLKGRRDSDISPQMVIQSRSRKKIIHMDEAISKTGKWYPSISTKSFAKNTIIQLFLKKCWTLKIKCFTLFLLNRIWKLQLFRYLCNWTYFIYGYSGNMCHLLRTSRARLWFKYNHGTKRSFSWCCIFWCDSIVTFMGFPCWYQRWKLKTI